MNNITKLLKNHTDYIILSSLISLWLIVLGILSVYFANIIDVLFQSLFHSINKNIALILIIKSLIIICIIILLIYLIFRNKKRFKFYSIANEQNLGENKFKAIVLPISSLLFRDYNQLKIEENGQEISIQFKDNFSFQIKNSENNNIDCVNNFFNEIKKFEKLKQSRLGFNWEVPLKIIYKIKKNQIKCPNCLKYIVLLGTEGQLSSNRHFNNNMQQNNDFNSSNNNNDNSSYPQLDKLEKLMNIFFSNNSDNSNDIKIIKRKLNDFENFTELSEKFEEIEEDIKKEYFKEYNDNKIKNYENYKEINDTEIAYDITGGQKLVSVVGTFFSLKSQSPILYVSQNNNDNIKVINAIYKMEPPE